MVDTRQKIYLIKRFEDIGWVDPFPDDCLDVNYVTEDDEYTSGGGDGPGPCIPADKDAYAYAESRLIKGFIPTVIYVPSEEMMFKMMRACIGVTDKKDLWIYKQGDAAVGGGACAGHDHGNHHENGVWAD